MASVVPMKSLLEAGVHFGHRTRRWNPKMKPFIFTERNGIHIIDLQQTLARLNEAYGLVRDTIAANGIVLFVGTKRQAQENIVREASRCHMPYVDQRWLGGTLSNWRTIRHRIDYLLETEKQQARGEFTRLVKKEALMKEREIARLNHRLGGLKEMRRLPNLLFVVDVRRDSIAVKEANILGIPVIAMVDTNCDPDPIDHIIPSNDDAIRAIKLMLTTMASAVLEGQAILNTIEAEEEEAAELEGEQAQERYLGPSTIAKLQAETEEVAETAGAEEKAPDTTQETAPAEPAPSPAAAKTEAPAAEKPEETAAATEQPTAEAASEDATAAAETEAPAAEEPEETTAVTEQPTAEAASEDATAAAETEAPAAEEPEETAPEAASEDATAAAASEEETPGEPEDAAETTSAPAAEETASAQTTPETAEEKNEEPAAALEEAVIERKEG